MLVKTVCSLLSVFYLSLSATTPYAPGRTIIQFKPELRSALHSRIYETGKIGNPAFDTTASRFGFYRVERLLRDPNLPADVQPYGLDLIYVAYFPESVPVEEVNQTLGHLPTVESAEPDLKLEPCRTPNDSIYPQETHLTQINAASAWDITIGDTTTIIADPDIGVWWMHEDIQPNLWINEKEDINHNGRFDTTDAGSGGDLNGIDDDDNGYVDDVIGWNFGNNTNNPFRTQGSGHGTATWGIASAATDNHLGIASLAWHCRGMGLCIADAQGYIYTSYAQGALYYALAKGACVASMSWGSYSTMGSFYNVLKYCHDHGMQLCGGAGNDHKDTPFYPAAYDIVIGVGGTDTNGKPWSSTNFGTWIDVCSPAVNVWTTSQGGGYGPTSATSFCTPIVAGLAALVRSANPRLKASQRDSIIFATCTPISDTLYDQGKLGNGQINAGAAVAAAILAIGEGTTPKPVSENRLTVLPNPSRRSMTINYHLSQPISKFQIYNAAGEIVRSLTSTPNTETLSWDGRDDRQKLVPAGIYFIQPKGENKEIIAKIVVVR
jgi:subtilisin family serine protease